jgi:hypothetical protein
MEQDGLLLGLADITRAMAKGSRVSRPQEGVRRKAPEPKFDCPSYDCSTQNINPIAYFDNSLPNPRQRRTIIFRNLPLWQAKKF